MTLNATSLAAVVGAAVKNEQFAPGTENLPRKILVMGSRAGTIETVVDPVPVFSAEDAAVKFGSGTMGHLLCKGAFEGSDGVECYASLQGDPVAAVAADGSFDFSGAATESGTIYAYIAGERIAVPVPSGTTNIQAATLLVAAITAETDLPVSAVLDTAAADVTSKSKGPWGNGIDLSLNLGFEEDLPAGLGCTITGMASGVGVPPIQPILDGLGVGDDKNELWFTDVCHGFGLDTGVIDDLSAYVGEGNDFTGLYDKVIARPFRVLMGDTTAGVAGAIPSALTTITDARKDDRANGILCVPGSVSHPAIIAAKAIGRMAKTNNDRAAQSYIGISLPGVWPGVMADRWTSYYDSRDLAVKAGLSPTTVEGDTVKLSNVLTFYRPDSVPVSSNGYRSMRNISILQNILFNTKLNFSQEKWQGISIVADIAKVSNVTDREKARDVGAVLDDLIALATGFEGRAWIYTAAYTIEELAKPGAVVIRSGGIGFDSTMKVILSGEGGIFDTVVKFDTSLAVLLSQ